MAEESLPLSVELRIDAACRAFETASKTTADGGPRPRIEDYLAAAAEPERGPLLRELLKVELHYRRGERLSPDEYRCRFPEQWHLLGPLFEPRPSAGATPEGPGDSCDTGDWAAPPGAAGDLGSTGPDLSPPGPAEASPPTVPGYEILGWLGRGGMGVVYKARHRRLDKLVALKVLSARAPDAPQRTARFLREMRAIGSLDHPNAVEAHDAGEHAGTVYLVMKFIEGTDMARLVKERGPLPVGEVCALARQAALGLDYLHGRGLVHRDLKPSNLMRTRDGTVKILDLGLARWRAEAASGDDLTGAGQVLGTADYLAPEQVRRLGTVDARADLYGLGGTLFYLLTGRAPFAHHQGLYDKLEAHCREAPPDVRALRPEVPAALAELVGRLLAKKPEDRPQTPTEVRDRLRAVRPAPEDNERAEVQGRVPAAPSRPAEPPDREPAAALLQLMWDHLDPGLQDAFLLAYNKKLREGGHRISTRDLFQALVRINDASLQTLVGALPEGALPEPVTGDIPIVRHVLDDAPPLADCVADSLDHFRQSQPLPRKLRPADLFVDLGKHGHGPSVARLRKHGVTAEELERRVRETGLSVLRRREGA